MSVGVGTAKSWLLIGPKRLSLSRASSKLLLSIVKSTNSYVPNMGMCNQTSVTDSVHIVAFMILVRNT